MESFNYDAGEPKEEKKPVKPKPKDKSRIISFIASIEGLASLKDGGIVLRLGLSSDNYANFARLLAVRNESQLLDIVAEIKEPETFGGNK